MRDEDDEGEMQPCQHEDNEFRSTKKSKAPRTGLCIRWARWLMTHQNLAGTENLALASFEVNQVQTFLPFAGGDAKHPIFGG